MRATLIGLVLLTFVGVSRGQAVDLEKVKLIEVGRGRYCKWSPDGKYLSFISGEGLMVYVVDSGTVRQVAPPEQIRGIHDFNHEWSGPEELLFVRKQRADNDNRRLYQRDCISIKLDGTTETLFSETIESPQWSRTQLRILSSGQVMVAREEADPPAAFRQMTEKAALSQVAYFVVANADAWHTHHWGMERDRDVWLVRSDGQPYKRVTNGVPFGLPVLSPNGQLILCSIGGVVIDLNGNILGQFDYAVDMAGWLPDSKRVIYTKLKQSHHDIIASDIYIADTSAKNEIQLADTPDKIELEPVVSPDMTMIAYRNYSHGGDIVEILDFGEVIR